MGQPAARLGVGAPAGPALPARGVPAGGLLGHAPPARPHAPVAGPAEPLSPGERARGAAGRAQVGRARARPAHGGPRAQSTEPHGALGGAQGREEARSQRHRAQGDTERAAAARQDGPRVAAQQRRARSGLYTRTFRRGGVSTRPRGLFRGDVFSPKFAECRV